MAKALSVLALFLLVAPQGGDAPVTREQIEHFMRTAKVVGRRDAPKGVTRPLRLTLSDGAFKHDAAFQAIDERQTVYKPDRGPIELNFVDSWKYNVAAYRLAGLLGLLDMMPVTIEYRYSGKTGALAWWMESLMDEGERLKKKIEPPDPTAWNNDMFRQRMFMELVEDSDRNLTNVLVSPEWRVLMIDFTRAFRLHATIRQAELTRGDKSLLAKIEALSRDEVVAATKPYLSNSEINAMMKRRDLIVAHYEQLVQKLGEARVLY